MHERLNDAIRAVSSFLVADVPLGATLDRIAELAVASIEGADELAITLLDDDAVPATAVWTGDRAPRLDQAQYDDGTGPCLDAFRQNRTLVVDDTAAVADAWPKFSRVAEEVGIGSTLSVPLAAGGSTFGVFNLYSGSIAAFGEDQVHAGSLFVTQAAVVLANSRAYWHMFDLATGLRTAMESRAAIEQAKGVIMATTGRSADDAFDLLRQQSQNENRKLRDVAQEIAHRNDDR